MKLSLREQEVVLEVAKGHDSNLCIARKLCIEEGTVNLHLRSIYKKTGTHNHVQLIRWAWREAKIVVICEKLIYENL